ncbi:sugar ABC transporter permease [Actinospica sp. MGRD01-02]|uniref:Sugar ABC transporter permease n=1 Tax=Actinospica acidithermotolerans TaxID=2828514 RepID=A0A941EAE8_9ACTN|nr:sugar ABC transporter permease [Actinospica acidithermotolerans]MBR7829190.1 sugar ABC transporter permease [Actinospica acidithermotolerans]
MTVATQSPRTARLPLNKGGARRPRRVRRLLGRLLPLGPALLLLAVFFAGPLIWSVYTAFTDMALSGAATTEFTGLENFRRMFADPVFVKSLELTVIFVIGSAVIGQNLLGMLLALILRGRGGAVRTIVNGVVIGAWVVPEVVAGFAWYAFLYKTGTLNAILGHFGLSQDWLYTMPMLAVILANTWRGTAFSMLVYSAALSDVPPELLEAAAVDGASSWKRLRYVTLPLIRRSIVSNLMLITLQTLASFGLIYVMTGGGPGNASSTTPLYMYQEAFQFYQLGYGTAMALVLLVLGALFSLIYLRLIKLEDS